MLGGKEDRGEQSLWLYWQILENIFFPSKKQIFPKFSDFLKKKRLFDILPDFYFYFF